LVSCTSAGYPDGQFRMSVRKPATVQDSCGVEPGEPTPGAAIAFLITGAGTSIASISGMLVIARWRVVALVIATLFVTAIAPGWLSALWL
jgi:hypothetical protein